MSLSALSGSEDLATVVALAVLAAVAARAVRQVLGSAGGVGAGHQRRRGGLPGRATVARVAARHLPLRDSHGSSFLGLSQFCSVWVLSSASVDHRGSTAASCAWSG